MLVIRTVLAPFRSNKAFVPMVVPMRSSVTLLRELHSCSRISFSPSRIGSLPVPDSESFFFASKRPFDETAIMSVKVPPRSIQKDQVSGEFALLSSMVFTGCVYFKA